MPLLTYSLAVVARAATEVLNGMPLGTGALALELAANLSRVGSAGDLRLVRRDIGTGKLVELAVGELLARLPFTASKATDSVRGESRLVLWYDSTTANSRTRMSICCYLLAGSVLDRLVVLGPEALC